MKMLFFSMLFLAAYAYVLYPMSLYILSRFIRFEWHKAEITPRISVIISVYNEEGVVKEKVENTLALDYPADLLEVIVSSDGSTDRTNEIVASFKDPRVKLVAFRERLGKTACLNRVVPEAKGELVVFTDANSMFPPDALSRIARNFADPGIGLVTGWTRYSGGGEAEDARGTYSLLETMTKHWESLIASCVGADGAIFALRRELYRPLEDRDINDLVLPLHTICFKKRVVLDLEVFCFEELAKSELKECRRQVRITNRTLGAIRRNLHVFNPFVYGWFSFFMISHKVIRLMVPFFLMGTLIMSSIMSGTSIFFAFALAVHLAFLALATAGILSLLDGRLINLCKTFLITLLSQFLGWVRFFGGKSDTMWTPQR